MYSALVADRKGIYLHQLPSHGITYFPSTSEKDGVKDDVKRFGLSERMHLSGTSGDGESRGNWLTQARFPLPELMARVDG